MKRKPPKSCEWCALQLSLVKVGFFDGLEVNGWLGALDISCLFRCFGVSLFDPVSISCSTLWRMQKFPVSICYCKKCFVQSWALTEAFEPEATGVLVEAGQSAEAPSCFHHRGYDDRFSYAIPNWPDTPKAIKNHWLLLVFLWSFKDQLWIWIKKSVFWGLSMSTMNNHWHIGRHQTGWAEIWRGASDTESWDGSKPKMRQVWRKGVQDRILR